MAYDNRRSHRHSSAGKSYLLGEAKRRWPAITTVESDEWVAGGRKDHVYGLFLELGREAALAQIGPREREFLASLGPVESGRLIASGPCVPRHDDEWSAFVERVKPVVVYLAITPTQALEGLRRRAAKQAEDSEMSAHVNFGSWDDGITTERDDGGRWIPVDDDLALRNIEQQMSELVPRYEESSRAELRFSRVPAREETFIPMLGQLLGVEELSGGHARSGESDG